MKVVINLCFGGFGLSEEACLWLYDHGHRWDTYDNKDQKVPFTKELLTTTDKHARWYLLAGATDSLGRTDPLLVQCVEALGTKRASGDYAKLGNAEIPDGIEFEITECDSIETVEEIHRAWSGEEIA